MKKSIAVTLVFILLAACASQKPSPTSDKANTASGDTRTVPVEYLDWDIYRLIVQSDDKTYGFTKGNPIKVGSEGSGPQNKKRFLNALLGPNGEEIKYNWVGNCCSFKTPNSLFDNTGMLDRYTITWDGNKQRLSLYLNMYDEGDLKIPVGLSAKKFGEKPPSNVLYLLNDKPIAKSEIEKIDPTLIISIDFIKDKENIKLYTQENYDGVIIIHLKKKP